MPIRTASGPGPATLRPCPSPERRSAGPSGATNTDTQECRSSRRRAEREPQVNNRSATRGTARLTSKRKDRQQEPRVARNLGDEHTTFGMPGAGQPSGLGVVHLVRHGAGRPPPRQGRAHIDGGAARLAEARVSIMERKTKRRLDAFAAERRRTAPIRPDHGVRELVSSGQRRAQQPSPEPLLLQCDSGEGVTNSEPPVATETSMSRLWPSLPGAGARMTDSDTEAVALCI